MSEGLPVEVVFFGEPFDKGAIIHTLRHLAMRTGWTFCTKAERRLIYATTDHPREVPAGKNDIIVLSSDSVKRHLAEGNEPLPLTGLGSEMLPFCHPKMKGFSQRGWINADVIAGAHALVNLMYERRNRPEGLNGWILFREDWWTATGFEKPAPLVDLWLNRIAAEAEKIGWPGVEKRMKDGKNPLPPTILLTHDVDYMPTPMNRGIPRFFRSLVRQLLVRRNVGYARQISDKYLKAFFESTSYNALKSIAEREAKEGAVSSFQFTVKHRHRHDPAYDLQALYHKDDDLRYLMHKGFEICMHGSYKAGRTLGRLAEEKKELERILGIKVSGHRQHYLNFHPTTFFPELEKAGIDYDMSVGYNDMSGPRAGTVFPYRPYDMERGRPFLLWEIPFILMDTTLATTYRFSPPQALDHCLNQIQLMEKSGGCVSIIWHQEQLSGLLDPGFDRIYWKLLQGLAERGIRMTSGQKILQELDGLWYQTIEQ